MELDNNDLYILSSALSDRITRLEQYHNFGTADEIAETKELLNRIRHEQVNRIAKRENHNG